MAFSMSTETVYEYIIRYALEHQVLPRQKKIAEDLFLSKSAVQYHLRKLERQGYLVFDEEKQYIIKELVYRRAGDQPSE